VREGLCVVFHNHTTAGLTLNSIADPATRADLAAEIDRLVPVRVDFHHNYDTPRDAAAHVKAMLVGHSATLPIEAGHVATGRFMGILLCEFDGPRDRTVLVQVWSGDRGRLEST
jgi:secondary thiamine-phosphate synthase enzyme